MTLRFRVPLVAALALAGTTSCTTFVPRPSHHIYYDGTTTYHRDGAAFRVGPLGGGVEALVGNDALALGYARRYQHLARRGMLLYLVGLGVAVVGPAGVVSSVPASSGTAAPWIVFGAGVVTTAFGIHDLIAGQASLFDAINAYNDDVDAAASGSVAP